MLIQLHFGTRAFPNSREITRISLLVNIWSNLSLDGRKLEFYRLSLWGHAALHVCCISCKFPFSLALCRRRISSYRRETEAHVQPQCLPEFVHSVKTVHLPDDPSHSSLMDRNPHCGQNGIYLKYNHDSSMSKNCRRTLSGIDSWSLRACHFRHFAQASVGVCSIWQLENNNRPRTSQRCRGETLTNQPGLSRIRADWLFLYDPEDNIRNLGCTSWNRIVSKYEMGSQGPE